MIVVIKNLNTKSPSARCHQTRYYMPTPTMVDTEAIDPTPDAPALKKKKTTTSAKATKPKPKAKKTPLKRKKYEKKPKA